MLLIGGELPDGPAEKVAVHEPVDLGLGIGVSRVCDEEVGGLLEPLLGTMTVDQERTSDAEQPWRELVVALLGDRSERAHEGLLGHVLGIVRVSDTEKAVAIDAIDVTLVELRERALVARPSPVQQPPLVGEDVADDGTLNRMLDSRWRGERREHGVRRRHAFWEPLGAPKRTFDFRVETDIGTSFTGTREVAASWRRLKYGLLLLVPA